LAVHTNIKKQVEIGFYFPWPNLAILEGLQIEKAQEKERQQQAFIPKKI
jgi:hypothetical protein